MTKQEKFLWELTELSKKYGLEIYCKEPPKSRPYESSRIKIISMTKDRRIDYQIDPDGGLINTFAVFSFGLKDKIK